jgi:hypothetical protein
MRAIVLQLEASLTPAEVDMIWELVDVDEPGIAFEMLCTQLYVYDEGYSRWLIKWAPGAPK